MSVADDAAEIRQRMLAIQAEEGRLHPADAADFVAGEIRRSLKPLVGQPNAPETWATASELMRDVAFPIKRTRFDPPVTIWGNEREGDGVMHLSADEFAQALADARNMGMPIKGVRLVYPVPSREAFEAAFPNVPWPGPHRHVRLYT